MTFKITTDQKGKSGELLVIYRLLRYGIESAHLTTDQGVDLVAYHSTSRRPMTIQVKTASARRVGKSSRCIGWTLNRNCPAHYIALVDFDREKVWLMDFASFMQRAQQQKQNARLWFYVETPKRKSVNLESILDGLTIEESVPRIFGVERDIVKDLVRDLARNPARE